MVDLSIIIPTLKDRDDIEVIDELDDQSFDSYELLIQRESGAAKARNEGIKNASADKLVFLDDDSIPCQGYLQTANDVLDDHPLVGGRIVTPQKGLLGELPQHYDHGREGKHIRMATGCNMACKRGVVETIGGFDENFDWGHEETDLVERAKAAGYQVWYEPTLVVYHTYADSIRDYWKKMWRHGSTKVYYDRKHGVPFERKVRNCIPIAPNSGSIPEFVVRSTGKGIRCIGKTYALLFGDIPDHETPIEPL